MRLRVVWGLGVLGMEYRGVNLFQCIPAQIVIAVSCGAQQAGFAYLMLLHGPQYLQLVIFRGLIDLREPAFQRIFYFFSVGKHLRRDPHSGILLF